MQRTSKLRAAFAILLAVVMLLPCFQAALAVEQLNFPLYDISGNRIADQNTQIITQLEQDPVSKFITASIIIVNGNTGSPAINTLYINGVCFEITFSEDISLYRYNPVTDGTNHPYDASRMYSGALNISTVDFAKYTYLPIAGFNVLGSNAFQNNASNRFIGATVNSASDDSVLTIPPGQSATVAQVFFMPTSSLANNILDLSMFKFTFRNNSNTPGVALKRFSNWIGSGSFFLVGDPRAVSITETYVVNKKDASNISQSFKMHLLQSAPAVTPDNDNRVIIGFNATDMEWSLSAAGPYTKNPLVVPDTAQTYYVRYPETAYSGSDPVYGNYKKMVVSAPTMVVFNDKNVSCANDVSLVKESTNKTFHADGKVHVNDTIEYTVTAKNQGNAISVWAGAEMVDTLPTGVTLVTGSVKLNGAVLTSPGGYTLVGNVLTVPLGDIYGSVNGLATQKVVTFDVTINNDAYGATIQNSVVVNGKDGNIGPQPPLNLGPETDGPGHSIVQRSAAPTIATITVGDTYVSGTGAVVNSQIDLTFPGGITAWTFVDAVGNWSLSTLPAGVVFAVGDIVQAVQTEPNKDPSVAVTTTVVARPDIPDNLKQSNKTSTNLTRSDGTRRVGDKLQYTITVKNAGPPKSLWENVIIVDEIPSELDYVPNSVKLDGITVGAPTAVFNSATNTLTVNLGDLASNVERVVTFEATLNGTAYGKTIINTAIVDNKPIVEPPYPPIPPVIGRSPAPIIDTVNEGDRVVTGTGVAGGQIVVSFEGSTLTRTATVMGALNTWSVNVPNSVNLLEGDKVFAVQTVGTDDPSVTVEAIVEGKTNVVPSVVKTSTLQSSFSDGFAHVGDKILYKIEITNLGAKSVWTNVIMTDVVPVGVTYIINSVKLDGIQPASHWYYSDPSSPDYRTLWVSIGSIPYGEVREVTFEATVDPDAHGVTIRNAVTVTGTENGDPTKPITEGPIDEVGPGHTVANKSAPPVIDTIYRDDRQITGTGVTGSTVVVRLPDNTEITTTVVGGTWVANLPATSNVTTGDTVRATQTEVGKDPSDTVEKIVLDKPYRAVHGYVWPIAVDDYGIPGFLDKHAVTVELRSTFLTPAGPALTTKAVPAPTSFKAATGEFTIANVPMGTYVLTISRPGYLIRAFMVTVSYASADIIEVAPPGTEDNGIFTLWWGDINGDMLIENKDMMVVISLMSLGYTVDAFDSFYVPYADPNADGVIDGKDNMLILEMWNRDVFWYAGTDNVDFFT